MAPHNREKVTLSVFVLSGFALQAKVTLEGPLAPTYLDDMASFQSHLTDFERNPPTHGLLFAKKVDFEHLRYDDVDDDDDDDLPPITIPKPGISEEEAEELIAHARRRNEKTKKRENYRIKDGEPYVRTSVAPADGWYRVCLNAYAETVIVEMEMRKESELGMTPDGAHVMTQEERLLLDEEEAFEHDFDLERRKEENNPYENMIRDADFADVTKTIRDLRQKITKIESLQAKELRRIKQHSATNEHSHKRMFKSSILETLVFVAITGFQVYLIRRWFTTGSPVLGR